MTTERPTDNYFSDAYQNRLDITDSYLAFGDIPDLVGVSVDNEEVIIRAIRRLLVQDGGGIGKISDLARTHREEASDLYHSDRIAAVDGTSAISPLRFVSDTIYAAGIVCVTPRSQHTPRARVTRTRASSYASSQDFSKSWEDNITQWGEYLSPNPPSTSYRHRTPAHETRTSFRTQDRP